jgi:hypothetical protein
LISQTGAINLAILHLQFCFFTTAKVIMTTNALKNDDLQKLCAIAISALDCIHLIQIFSSYHD